MEHKRLSTYKIKNRIGFHYFPDTLHYRDKDLSLWLPRLKELDAGYLVFKSPINRAVPENFITTLVREKIDIIIDFDLPLSEKVNWADLETLLRAYGKWGVKYALLNHQPNSQAAWGEKYWKQTDLVKTYTQQFLQFAKLTLDNGIKPVLSPLVPGGDFWDTAFLKEALQILVKSAESFYINNTVLSAYSWDFGKPLDWGLGGQKTWKEVKPYKVPRNSQDQRGFRTYEWYTQIAQEILGKTLPIILLQTGINTDPRDQKNAKQIPNAYNLEHIYTLLKGKNVFDAARKTQLVSAISPQVLAANFYLLSADDSSNKNSAWFTHEGVPTENTRRIINKFRQGNKEKISNNNQTPKKIGNQQFKFGRYVLIAESLKPDIQEILKNMHEYIKRYKPVVGFSTQEAMHAAYILVIANNGSFSQEDIQKLQQNGNLVKILKPEEIKHSIN